ncbi:MAG: guanylate kinase [Terriglobia bacterium]
MVFIVSGPSGVGKTTLVEHLLKTPTDLMFSVSYTTRAARPDEKHGRDYWFVSREIFEDMIRRGEFLEYADVFGSLYGTHRRVLGEAAQQGKDLVLDIDVQGARQVKAKVAEAVAIFLLPPSAPELERRLRARGLDALKIIRQRLEHARQEIESYDAYDYVVVNRTLAEACAQVEAIVVAERQRRAHRPLPAIALQEAAARAAAARKEANRGQISAILETFEAQTP